jgi:hypothetical protein
MEDRSPFTYCSECEHRMIVVKGDHPSRWLCRQHRRADAISFVDRSLLISAPFARCERVNMGFCKLYEPARGTEDSMP